MRDARLPWQYPFTPRADTKATVRLEVELLLWISPHLIGQTIKEYENTVNEKLDDMVADLSLWSSKNRRNQSRSRCRGDATPLVTENKI